ncbi:hypothetical protein [Novosphingobium sp. G106]|nr:hypothetical protein [Novosphingobium sp. G106]
MIKPLALTDAVPGLSGIAPQSEILLLDRVDGLIIQSGARATLS